jgi:proteasome maturation protein
VFIKKEINRKMNIENSLPIYSGPVDHLRHGFRSLEHELSNKHPIETLQKSQSSSSWNMKLDMVRRTYGSHLAMRLATEKEIFGSCQRLPGLQSSNIGLETVLGTDERMEFSDFLNGKLFI